MKIAVKRTGLTPHVIRVWEKRYGAVTPARTKTNRRLYDDIEIERLRLLGLATKAGHSIKSLANLPTGDLTRLVEEVSALLPSEFSDQALAAIKGLDTGSLHRVLSRASVELGRTALLHNTLAPLIEEIGRCWQTGKMRVAHEHLATAVIRNFIGDFSHAYTLPIRAPRIVVTTPAGQLHELGAILAAAAASAHGWQVTYLGPSLPSEEIASAAIQSRARAVALSIVYPEDDFDLVIEFRKLRRLLSSEIAVITGGRAAQAYEPVLSEIGAIQLQDLSTFYLTLDNLRKPLMRKHRRAGAQSKHSGWLGVKNKA